MIEKLKNERIRCQNLHVLGDVVEGKLNHRGQNYETFPIEVQQELAVKALKTLIVTVKPVKVYVLPGNHDRKYCINLLDNVVEELIMQGVNIEYYRDSDYYIVNNMLLMHGISRTGGSDYTGLTPLILNNIIALALQHGVERWFSAIITDR